MRLFITQKINPNFLNLIILLIVAFAVVFGSLELQGRYSYDPHHWGLMLSNARDLSLGLLPYKEIFIQYGFLTTAIHALAFLVYPSLLSIYVVTALFYSAGLFIIFLIARLVLKDFLLAVLVLLFAYGLHPIVIYPWSNYIFFPFYALGVYFLLEPSCWKQFFAGVFLGLAILCREGGLIAIFALILVYILVKLKWDGLEKTFYRALYIAIGLLIPLFLFFVFLSYYDLIIFWKKLAIDLPKIYLNYFPHMKSFHAPELFISNIYHGMLNLDLRWLAIGAIFISNLGYLIYSLCIPKGSNYQILVISASSLFITTSVFHIPEIFRFATGSVIGVITLFYILAKINFFKYLLGIYVTALIFTGFQINSGNAYFPSATLKSAISGEVTLAPFKGMFWSNEVISYYSKVSAALVNVSTAKGCNIQYHYNESMDAFLQVISPFKQFQIAPFGVWDDQNLLRPDLDFKRKISNTEDIVLFKILPVGSEYRNLDIEGYFQYLVIDIPNTNFLPKNYALIILVPNKCQLD